LKIAITGGLGFIGRWFMKLFQDQYRFVVLGRSNVKLDDFRDIMFDYRQTNYSAQDLLYKLKGVDRVIHLAAQSVTNHELTFDDFIHSNTLLTNNVFSACAQLKITQIVYTSSRLVYSNRNRLPWRENDDPKPNTFYGISKLSTEKLADYYNHNYDMSIKTLRFAQVIGLGDEKRNDYVFNKFINKAINKEPLTLYGKGLDKKEYLYVKDAVLAIKNALNGSSPAEIYNIGMGVNFTINELALLINEVFDNEGNLGFANTQEQKESEGLMDINKAKGLLGFSPKWTLKPALYDMKEDLLKTGFSNKQ